MAKSKQIDSKTPSNKDILHQTLPPKLARKHTSSDEATPAKRRRISQKEKRLATDNAEPPVRYKKQSDYVAAHKHHFDYKRASLDEAADKQAQDNAFREVKARVCNVERSTHDNQARASNGSSGSEPIINDPTLIHDLGLYRNQEEHCTYLSRLEHKYVEPLEEAYPPLDHWASENLEATKYWNERRSYTQLKEGRDLRWIPVPVMQLDRSKMTVVRPDESIIFYDAANPAKPVLCIIRDLVRDEEVVKALGVLSMRATRERRDVRRDDPGFMVNVGYTAGPLDNRGLATAQNMHSKKKAASEAGKQQDLEDGGWLALLWTIMLSSLPRVITKDYDDFIAKMGLPRMATFQKDAYEVKLGNNTYQFTGGHLAPSAGVTAFNYQKETHTDNNGNEYMISFTCHANADPASGGNFYLAKYGILVEQASNTCVAWMTKDAHGTTMANPVPGRQNYGVSFDLPVKLAVAKKNSERKAAAEAEEREVKEE